MPKIISLISRKGGTGKTTNAINLATMIFNLGHKLVLIETDTNYTLSTLRQMELHKTGANNDTIFQILGSEDHKVIKEIEELKREGQLDYIIVDSAGKTTDESIRNLCIHSDVIIVPTSLTQNDLLVTYQTIEDIKHAREHNPNMKLLVMPNRIHSQTKMETVKESLEQLDAHILDSKVPMKNIFANFSTILPEKEYLEMTKEILQIANKHG